MKTRVRERDGKCRTSSRASNKSVEHIIPRRTYREDSASGLSPSFVISTPFLRLSVSPVLPSHVRADLARDVIQFAVGEKKKLCASFPINVVVESDMVSFTCC